MGSESQLTYKVDILVLLLYYIFIEGNRSAKCKVQRSSRNGVFESRDLGGARRVASQLVAKITIDPEPCTIMLLERLRKSDRSLGYCSLCLQHMSKDQPWLLWVSRETRSAARTLTSVSLERAVH